MMLTPELTARLVDGGAMVLAHSLWIGSLAAIVVAALLRRLPAQRADLRAGVAFAGLVISLAGSVAAPFVTQATWRSATAIETTPTANLNSQEAANPSPAITNGVTQSARSFTPPTPAPPQASWRRAIVGAWLIGVAVSLVRLGRSHVAARRLVRDAAPAGNRSLEVLLDQVAQALSIVSKATLRVTDRVATPLVYGFWSPVILLPASLATGATPETLRVVIAHELWHLRRGDLWQTIVQRLVEATLFYHPAVWWLSRQADREREAACDAAAARVVGDGVPVATALLDAASLGVTTPSAALGFGGGSLAERVQRLLRPSEQPRVRVAWGGLLALSLLGVAALLSLTAGTGLVAREVVVAMTPAERVAAIEQAIAENEPAFIRDIKPFSSGNLRDGAPRCRVVGRFVTPKGEPLPNWPYAALATPGISKSTAVDAQGVFESKSIPLDAPFFIVPNIDGYAFTTFGPYTASGEVLDLGDLQLSRGFESRLVVTDEDDKRIEAATLTDIFTRVTFADGRSYSYGLYREDLRSDSSGVIELDRLVDSPLEVTVQKPGYERLRKEVTFTPGGSVTLKLRRSQPTTGRLVDTAGNPVAGAEVYCVTSEGDTLYGGDPRSDFLDRLDGRDRSRQPLVVTDANGEFSLSSLKDSASYALLALHHEHQPTRLDYVRAGQQLGDIVAQPPLEVRGRVLNAATPTSLTPGKPLYYSNALVYASRSMTYGGDFSTTIDGEGYFVLRQLLPGSLTIQFDGQEVSRKITHSIDDLEIDLGQAEDWRAKNLRDVRVRIAASNDQPVRGSVNISWRLAETPDFGPQNHYAMLDVPTEGDPIVELQAPIGAELWFSNHQLVGAYAKQQRLGLVPPGEGAFETTATVEPAGLVVGQVLDARGAPLLNCQVRLSRTEGPPHGTYGGAYDRELTSEGRFSIGPLPLGEEWQFVCEVQVNGTWRFLKSEPFQVTAAKPIHELTLTVPDPVFISGQVLDHHGQPISPRHTAVSHSNAETNFEPGSGPIDDTGRFRIAITPGPTDDTYSLKVRPTNDSAGISLRYAPGRSRTGRDFGVVRLGPGSTIRGVVTTEDGKPVVGVEVSARARDPDSAAYSDFISNKTNESGEFELEGVERVLQKVETRYPFTTIKSAEPASALTKEKYVSPYVLVEPSDEPTELRIVVSDEK